ncbi:hypothetical protein O3M35_001526 [Rhynocoris fuscipes]|uniref:Polyprotein n=1 Tax=Rhynocoris fuscipes TaxID=488301 RepID=A0AAW1CVC4_9HEMI
MYPSCAVTRSMAKLPLLDECEINLADTLFGKILGRDSEAVNRNPSLVTLDLTTDQLIKEQQEDPSIAPLFDKVQSPANQTIPKAQEKMKSHFDRKAFNREISPGDLVLALLPSPGNSLGVKYSGPYTVLERLNDVNYIIKTTDRRKNKRLRHINMLKQFNVKSKAGSKPLAVCCSIGKSCVLESVCSDCDCFKESALDAFILQNSSILCDIERKFNHLVVNQKLALQKLLYSYPQVFSDTPTQTNKIEHDIETITSEPIKLHPYRVSPFKQKLIDEEIEFLLNNDLIEPSRSAWSSPCLLVPKPDGSVRLVTDYRKLNSITKADSYPIPRIDDCIDSIGHAKFVTKFDLAKGFWQVPLTQRAKEVSAFVTAKAFYQHKAMAARKHICENIERSVYEKSAEDVEDWNAWFKPNSSMPHVLHEKCVLSHLFCSIG